MVTAPLLTKIEKELVPLATENSLLKWSLVIMSMPYFNNKLLLKTLFWTSLAMLTSKVRTA